MYPILSKKHATYIRKLSIKKHRLENKSFLLEGKKSIQLLLDSHYEVQCIVGTPAFFIKNQAMVTSISKAVDLFSVHPEILSKLGYFSRNQDVLAIATIPSMQDTALLPSSSGMILALDDIRDPGNLGTIIRIADWYGIKTILCSKTTVELYNQKVLQASMGSFINVNLYYVQDLPNYLRSLSIPILGTMSRGIPVHDFSFPHQSILVIGNESNGIHTSIQEMVTYTIAIPGYGTAESLNAAIAAAVICDNWKRNILVKSVTG